MKFSTAILLTAVTLLLFSLSCNQKPPPSEKEKTYASLSDTVKYVGMESCRSCHQSIYDSFIQTGMGKSFDVASKKKSSARFQKHDLVYDKHSDFWYQPFWDGDSLRIKEFRLEGKDTVYQRIETISYIVGSGQHTNSHLVNTNGYLYQAPATFYTQKGKWDLPPGFEDGYNTRFTRSIALECMSCHNSFPEIVEGSENKYTFVPNGITCERCHGPGEMHVAEKRKGNLVDVSREIDYTIVNPAKLPVDLQFDVCQRCHIQGNAVLNEGKSFFDFRPGMKLSDVMNVYMPVYKGREDEHIMASHAERMKMSLCYTETMAQLHRGELKPGDSLRPYKNVMTCVTCHNPHQSVTVTPAEHFNSKCHSCHNAHGEMMCTVNKQTSNIKHLPIHRESNSSLNCISCHMPRGGSTDIPHVEVTDHFIRKPVKESDIEKIKIFVGIDCINNPIPPSENKGRAFIAYFEKFGFEPPVLDSALSYLDESDLKRNFIDLVHIYYLKRNYRKIISLVSETGNPLSALTKKSFDNRHAWTCYRIAEAYSGTDQKNDALPYFRRAYELASYDLNFANKYATALISNGNHADAKKVLEFVISENPKNASAYTNLGYLKLIVEKDTSSARHNYDKALALNPDYEQALLNKAGLFVFRKKYDDARIVLKKILKKYPENETAKSLLRQLARL